MPAYVKLRELAKSRVQTFCQLRPTRITKANYFILASVGFLALASVLPGCGGHGSGSGLVSSTPQKVTLGKALFNDTTLSNPQGMSCATCHDPSAGFTGPNSAVNLAAGPVEGAVQGRFGNRLPPQVSYAAFLPTGIPTYSPPLQAYVGGLFWDGRAANLTAQAQGPFVNPNEMNNLLHNVADPGMVVAAVQAGPSASLFRQVYGANIFSQPTSVVYTDIADAIAAFESSPSVSPFNSKYDAYVAGKVQLSADELDGLRMFTGSYSGRPGGAPYPKNAQCATCHGIPSGPGQGPDIFTNSCYANIGVPRNPGNPYYTETNKTTDPVGYNAAGENYVDLGLGDFLYPQQGKAAGDFAENDPLQIDGTFKAPSVRNVDKRPSPGFVKAYMHNGYFKSLADVVHFYNTRNLTTVPGEVIDFTQPNPYAGLQGTPLWPKPEYMSAITLQNASGAPNSPTTQIGNLGLSATDEAHLVAFLKTLSDGYSQ